MRWLSIILFVVMLSPAARAASDERTDQLLWYCLGERPDGAEFLGKVICGRYLDGILDMHSMATTLAGAKPMFCLPPTGISTDQAMRVFIKWAQNNPAKLHTTARISVVRMPAAINATRCVGVLA